MSLTPEEVAALSFDALAEHLRLSRVRVEKYQGIRHALETEMERRLPTHNFRCSKCNHTQCELHQLRSSGGFLSAAFNLQNQRFTAVVCSRCKFTELYHGKASTFQQVADFFIGG